ncbi:MAG: thioredoxin fold domain-containing protein [Gammaproteobacteria bacterium]|nr:thioredoxin fold domain-containing protein [Gammaproteobacteria bacterium]
MAIHHTHRARNVLLSILAQFLTLFTLHVGYTFSADYHFENANKDAEFPDWFKKSFFQLDDDIKEAAAAQKRVALFFHQDHCIYCSALIERSLSQKPIEELMRKHFDVIVLNIWGDAAVTGLGGRTFTEKTLAEHFSIQFTPTLLFLDEQGAVVLRVNGYQPPQRLALALNYVSQHQEKNLTFDAYTRANLPPATSKSLHKEPFLSQQSLNFTRMDNHRPVIVYFEQGDCPLCDALHKQILSHAEVQSLLKSLNAYQLDMWSNKPVVMADGKTLSIRAWAKALGIRYAPTVVMFDENGKEIIRADGQVSSHHAAKLLNYVASGTYRTEPSYQRYLLATSKQP